MQLELFRDYLNREMSLIPLIQGTKIPVFSWKKYQYRRAKEETVKRWVKKGYNLGIVGGDISGLVMIDVDDEARLPELKIFIPEIEETAQVKTPNGHHFYFNTAENFAFTDSFLGLDHVELRSAGHQCVAPDSIVDGIPYVWEAPLDHILPFPDRFYIPSTLQDDPGSPAFPPFRSDGRRCIQQILNHNIRKRERNKSLFCLYCLLLKKNEPAYAMAIVDAKNRSMEESLAGEELRWICHEDKNSYHRFGCEAVRKRLAFVDCSNCRHFYRGFKMKENLILKNYKSIPDLSPVEFKLMGIIELHFDGETPSITKLSRTSKIDWRIVNKAVQQLKEKSIL
ncbi:hypothetical protein ES703_17446 [subsurface metagenome]